jgi:serine/threonine protein kinase
VTTTWHAVFGLPENVGRPDLYQLLGLVRQGFDPALIEGAFKARMARLESKKGSIERRVFEELGGELLRARRTLGSTESRAAYDREQKSKRSAKLRRVMESTLAGAALTIETEKAIVETGVTLGYSEEEAREALRAQLTKTQAAAREAKKRKTATQRRLPATASGDGGETRAGTGAPAKAAAPVKKGDTERDLASVNALVGSTIDDKYEVIAQIGSGGMGSVFKARHKLLDKLVALKVVSPHLSLRQDVRERFLREARAAMEFVHPNAVPLRDFGHTRDGLLFMTQDFSPGETLAQIVEREGALPIGRALALVRQCLLALGEAHRKGIVHRDMKPDNILVEQESGGRGDLARVCDFGIAKITDGGADDSGAGGLTGGSVIGTPHYMAPEQGAGDKVDTRADLYACGCVLYELLTGRKLFDADTGMRIIMMHVTQAPAAPSKARREISRELDQLVAKALAKAPRDRFQTAEEFVAAIDALPIELPGRLAPLRTPSARVVAAASSAAVKKTPTDLSQKFCDRCGGSVPEKWQETKVARRVGTRLICASCWAPVAAGKACLGCLTPLGPGVEAVAAGGGKRICKACTKKAELLRTCRGCKVLLPSVAFERGDAFAHGGKFYCKECYRARRKKG